MPEDFVGRDPHTPAGGAAPTYLGQSLDAARFDAIYNKLSKTYDSIGQLQVLGIASIYTEAAKQSKPDLTEELLIALATAAVGTTISYLGSRLAGVLERKLLSYVADPGSTTNEVLKDAYKSAQENVKYFAKATNDGFKDGIKTATGPEIKRLLETGKKPIDAFFEGQKTGAVEGGKRAYDKSEDSRPGVLALAALDPRLPSMVAQALLAGVNEVFADAQEEQKRQTLVHWLDYQAQSGLGSTVLGSVAQGKDVETTDLGALLTHRALETPGVLVVDAYITAVQGETYTAFPQRGHLGGLSVSMLKTVDSKPIRDLGLPIVYRLQSRQDRSGQGNAILLPITHAVVSLDHFTVAVNELGSASVSPMFPWQEEALSKIGGTEKVHSQLGVETLKELGVEADKE